MKQERMRMKRLWERVIGAIVIFCMVLSPFQAMALPLDELIAVEGIKSTGCLAVTNTVFAAGNETYAFKFSLDLTNAPDSYSYVISNPLQEAPVANGTLESGINFELGRMETLTVYDLPPGTAFSITMEDASIDGFDTDSLIKSGVTVNLETSLVEFISSKDYFLSRIAGSNRYATAALTSQAITDQSDTVVLTSGLSFPDALTGIAYADELNAPILLSRSADIPAQTLEEIKRLNAKKVIILGGALSIGQTVETDLRNMGIEVIRIQGKSRYETAVKIGDQMKLRSDKLFLASGATFADAVSVGSASAENDIPVLLTNSATLPVVVKDAIQRWGIKEVIIVGGVGAVSAGIETQLKGLGLSVERIGGSTRYETNYLINSRFFPTIERIYVASGQDYPDALTGALLASTFNTTVALTKREALDPSASRFINERNVSEAILFGGTLTLNDAVSDSIEGIIKNSIPPVTPEGLQLDNEVTILDEGTVVTDNGSSVTIPSTTELEQVKVGDIVTVGYDKAFKVQKITDLGDDVVIDYSEPEIQEVMKSLNVEGEAPINFAEFIPAEGVTITSNTAATLGQRSASPMGEITPNLSYNLKGTKKITDEDGLVWTLDFSFEYLLASITYDLDINFLTRQINKALVKVNQDIKIEASVGNLNNMIESSEFISSYIPLGKVPVAGVQGMGILLEVGLSLGVGGRFDVVFQLTGDTGLQIQNNSPKFINTLQSSASAQAMAKIRLLAHSGVQINMFGYDVISFEASGGPQISGKVVVRSDATYCMDAVQSVYLDLSALENTVFDEWFGLSQNWVIWDEYNSPVLNRYHMENLQMVDFCRYEGEVIGGAYTTKKLVSSTHGVDGLKLSGSDLMFRANGTFDISYIDSQGGQIDQSGTGTWTLTNGVLSIKFDTYLDKFRLNPDFPNGYPIYHYEATYQLKTTNTDDLSIQWLSGNKGFMNLNEAGEGTLQKI